MIHLIKNLIFNTLVELSSQKYFYFTKDHFQLNIDLNYQDDNSKFNTKFTVIIVITNCNNLYVISQTQHYVN